MPPEPRYPLQGAACATRGPDLWFGRDPEPAILVCNGCRVRRACLADADATETPYTTHGVRGGLTASERITRRDWLRRRPTMETAAR